MVNLSVPCVDAPDGLLAPDEGSSLGLLDTLFGLLGHLVGVLLDFALMAGLKTQRVRVTGGGMLDRDVVLGFPLGLERRFGHDGILAAPDVIENAHVDAGCGTAQTEAVESERKA